MSDHSTSIWWLRRDLRLGDNPALQAAVEASNAVIPVFVLDPVLLESGRSSDRRTAFILSGLKELDDQLRRLGSYLVLRRGEPAAVLGRLAAENGVEKVYAEPDYSPYARTRDAQVERDLRVVWCGSPAVFPPDFVLKSDGTPYRHYAPFAKAWMALPHAVENAVPFRPKMLKTPPNLIRGAVPDDWHEPSEAFPAGEAEAERRLNDFLGSGIGDYHRNRDRLDLHGTSVLSPYLRFGMIPARRLAAAARSAARRWTGSDQAAGAEAWLRELIWRDFYISVMYHFPKSIGESARYRAIRWRNSPGEFDAWKAGETGYPIVDAAMRQLRRSGWIGNRARMIVASFLVKDLLIDWRWGERWFMQNLIDGDPAANIGGWQWIAGTGTDSAPYFRIFNPTAQSVKADPAGRYIRSWLPELAAFPDAYIHAPWTAPRQIQDSAGCRIGSDYPAPIVDHADARQRALEAYRS